MGWIAQAYEGEVHVVPDTDEERHVLEAGCWCGPVRDRDLPVWSHHDEADRILARPACEG